MFFVTMLHTCACAEREDDVSMLEEILYFATGCRAFPPIGFTPTPKVCFLHDDLSRFPKANTCENKLHLPVVHDCYESFADDMSFAIKNTGGFGYA